MKTTINKLQTNTEKDVVIVHFTVQKEVESQYARVNLPEPDEENYIPYEDLTEEVVLEWVENSDEYERATFLVNKRLEEKQEILEPQLPWTESENNIED